MSRGQTRLQTVSRAKQARILQRVRLFARSVDQARFLLLQTLKRVRFAREIHTCQLLADQVSLNAYLVQQEHRRLSQVLLK